MLMFDYKPWSVLQVGHVTNLVLSDEFGGTVLARTQSTNQSTTQPTSQYTNGRAGCYMLMFDYRSGCACKLGISNLVSVDELWDTESG